MVSEIDNTNFESQPSLNFDADCQRVSLSSSSLSDIRALNAASGAATGAASAAVPDLEIFGKGDATHQCNAEVQETTEQRMDRAIRDCFGADVYNHLNDWDWLIAHRNQLEAGFRRAHGLGPNMVWNMALRMRELSTVDGTPLIFLQRLSGPTHGSLIPKRHDIMLRRGGLLSHNYLSHVHH